MVGSWLAFLKNGVNVAKVVPIFIIIESKIICLRERGNIVF